MATAVGDIWPNGAPSVGQRASRSREVQSEDIVRFTEISGDRNPVCYTMPLPGAAPD
jgi:acyl dehydratase